MILGRKRRRLRDAIPRCIDDGFGNYWVKCDDERCSLQIVRPGKVQCEADIEACPNFERERAS